MRSAQFLLLWPLPLALNNLATHSDQIYVTRWNRYMERGTHDGAPRYRNSNNIFLFRHKLNRSTELGITRQTCLPESELAGEETGSAACATASSLGPEVSGKSGMDFSRLVKTSLLAINLDRKVGKQQSSHFDIVRRPTFSRYCQDYRLPVVDCHYIKNIYIYIYNTLRFTPSISKVQYLVQVLALIRRTLALYRTNPCPPSQDRVRLNHQRIARAVAKIDNQFEEQMTQASATLNSVEKIGGVDGSTASQLKGVDNNRDLAVMAASDSAKVKYTLGWALSFLSVCSKI